MTFPWLSLFRGNKSAIQPGGAASVAGPDFICIGMQKAGTRWLYDQLSHRPDVWMPPIKELTFLGHTTLAARNQLQIGNWSVKRRDVTRDEAERQRRFMSAFSKFNAHIGDMDWYGHLFDPKGRLKSGDISPAYSTLEGAAIRSVAQHFPECRFILLVRHPVDRLWSALCHKLRKGRVNKPEICDWDQLLPILQASEIDRRSYPTRTWRHFADHVDPAHIRFWFFDDIATRPDFVRDEICSYLGVATGAGDIAADFNRKEGHAKIPMPDAIRLRLSDYFHDEIEECARLFGGHAVQWAERARAARTGA